MLIECFILGIEIGELTGVSSDVDASIEYLVLKHPELKSVSIGRSNCTDQALQAIMSKSGIADIRGSNSNISGVNLQLETGSTLDLETLDLGGCENLTSQGLKNILGYVDRYKLKELNLRETQVSLEEINCVINTFPNLEILCLRGCSNITDVGLVSFLNKAGGNLKKIDVFRTNI